MGIKTDNSFKFKDFNNANAWIDLQQEEYEQLVSFAKYRIRVGLDITGNKKTNVCKQGSRFYECLKKYMVRPEREWGLGESSIKNYIEGKFGKNRYQFLDYLNGIKEFFYLDDISRLFLADEDFFKKEVLDAKRRSEKSPEKKISLSDEDILKSILNQTLFSRAFWLAYLITFLFCFVGTASICYFSGTLIGNDPARKYFLHDTSTIINFLIICPSYVGLNIIIINTYKKLTDDYKHNPIEIVIWIGAVLLVLLVLSTNYTSEILNPKTHTKVYWYIANFAENGDRKLGFIGIYYLFLNFILLFFLINPLFIFIYSVLLFSKFTKYMEHLEADIIREKIYYFSYEYILLKSSVVLYIGNAYTWKLSNPQNSINFFIFIIILTIVGISIVPATRHYVKKNFHHLLKTGIIAVDDLDPSVFREISYLLDAGILAMFINIFWF